MSQYTEQVIFLNYLLVCQSNDLPVIYLCSGFIYQRTNSLCHSIVLNLTIIFIVPIAYIYGNS